ncbi:MAG: tetratricopeptide repeat protein [Terriglobia bacterium]|jgi:tetratricopeptide (TPR) repeat protein
MGTSSNSITGAYGITLVFWGAAALIGGLSVDNLPAAGNPQKTAADYCLQAQALLASEKFQDAREASRRALEIDSHSAEAECLLGMAELALGNFDAAGKDLEEALQWKPGLIPAHRALGGMYLNQNRLNDARRQFDLVLASYPHDFDSLYGVGLTFLHDHQPGAAVDEFDKALKIKPREPSLLASLLQAQLQLKREASATATLTMLDGQFNQEDPRRMELAAMLVSAGAYRLAIQQFQRLLEIQPESYDLNYNLALAYHRAAEEDQAAALLASLLEHKDNAELQNLLGDVEESRGNKSRSLAAYRRAAELQSRNEEYRYDYAQSLVRASSLNEAVEVFQAATRDFPGSVRMWLGWGAAYYLEGNYAGAAQTFLQAADVAPQNPQVYYLLGRAYDAAGTLQDTIAQRFAGYLARQPQDAWAEYFYGKILAARAQPSSNEGLVKAQQHLERAITLDGRLAEPHAELGSILEKRNQFVAARRELERAVELDPKSSAAFYKLGELYRQMGERERAQKALEKFHELKASENKARDREAIQGFLEGARE